MYPVVKQYCDIVSLIENKDLMTCFQPIVSVIKKSLIGLEGLSRGITGNPGEFISPDILFQYALENDLTVELDRLCREKSLSAFKEMNGSEQSLLLFLNMDASILDKVVGSKYLLHETLKRNLQVGDIVIEINETRVNDLRCLKNFIDSYREYGFLIALDDVGSGFSNLDRIPLTRPDIIKIDKGIVRGIDKQYVKQEVFKSLVGLSKKIGALVVAEGIETEEEAMLSLELGADLLQGFYFSPPVEASLIRNIHCEEKINYIASHFKSYIHKKNRDEKLKQTKYDLLIKDVCLELSKVSIFGFNSKLQELINYYRFIECLYIVDKSGIQISETICRPNLKGHRSSIFQPAQKGENHSLKSYYYSLINFGLTKYVTSPYISMATGKLCITLSAIFKDCNDTEWIFCIDFDPDNIKSF